MKTDKFKFLGMYGESPDTSGGFGQDGVDAFAKFLEAGGTIVAADSAVRFPIEFGFARTIDTEGVQGVNAQKPLVQAEIVRTDHPVFYGYADRIIPVKYATAQTFFRVGLADQGNILARFVGGDAAVLSGLMVGGDAIRQRAFAVDVPERAQRQGTRDHVLEQPDLPLAEPRRVQHDLQFDSQLERSAGASAVAASATPAVRALG